MDKISDFYEHIKNDMTVTLATQGEGSVNMRYVSPVLYEKQILIFTSAASLKYRQLKENNECAVQAGTYFACAKAAVMGPTMLGENSKLRDAYEAKFKGAFDEGIAFGGRDAEFILLKPYRLSGWAYNGTEDIPSVPFMINID